MEPWTQRDQLILAARLYADGISQAKIAETLEQTQSSVSRLIKEAEKEKLIEIRRYFNDEYLSDKDRAVLEKRLAPDDFEEAIDAWIQFGGVDDRPKIRIYPSGSTDTSRAAWAERLSAFSRLSAPYFLTLLQQEDVKNLGVSWGKQLWVMLQHIKNHSVKKRTDLRTVPLCPELNAKVNIKYSSSFLSQEFDDIFQDDNDDEERLSLGGVPALLTNTSMAKNFLAQYAQGNTPYAQVFGKEGLAHSLDAIVTSVGPFQEPYGTSFRVFREASKMSKEKISKLVIGDIGGILMPTWNQTQAQEKSFLELRKLWTGVQLDDLKNVSDRARGRRKPGVVVIAIGAAKARVCLEATRYGASHLLIDDDLAQEIVKLWKNDWQPKLPY